VDFLIHSRASSAPAHPADEAGLNERHWTYMDGFAGGMTARGPTLAPDRETWTGSLHIVDLSGPEAAREFVAQEPYQQAGLFEEHSIWRFTNLLGRTMWEFTRPAEEPRYVVLAAGSDPVGDLSPALRDRVIVHGRLGHLDDDRPVGVALAVQAPSREVLDTMLAEAGLGGDRVDVHDWEFGGRR
jgi:uncharacterized protein YciI